MLKNHFIQFATASTLAVACSVVLAEQADSKEFGWNGSGEAGYNHKTGNVTSDSLLARLNLNLTQEQTDYKSLLEVENKTEDKQQISERYVLDLQADRYFSTEKDYYGFLNARGEQDKVAGTEHDLALATGIGKVLYRSKMSRFSGEIGLGYQEVEYTEPTSDNPNFDQATGRLKLDFTHKFNDSLRFVQDVLYVAGNELSKVESNSSLRASINSKFSVSTSYKHRYNSSPAEGAKKTDTETNLTLIYTF